MVLLLLGIVVWGALCPRLLRGLLSSSFLNSFVYLREFATKLFCRSFYFLNVFRILFALKGCYFFVNRCFKFRRYLALVVCERFACGIYPLLCQIACLNKLHFLFVGCRISLRIFLHALNVLFAKSRTSLYTD